MRIFPIALTLMSLSSSIIAQDESFSITIIEAGPSLSLPLGPVRDQTVFGIGADVKASGPLTFIDENLYVGGRFMYNALVGKGQSSRAQRQGDGKTVHNIGIMASAEYIFQDMIVVEANVGLGISVNRFNTFGLATSGFIGYKLPDLERPVKVGIFVSRITLSTLHFGVKGTIQLN